MPKNCQKYCQEIAKNHPKSAEDTVLVAQWLAYILTWPFNYFQKF